MKPRFEVLDIFRGLFASMVVFHHLVDYTTTPVIHNQFFRHSDLFVDFFFILSGFVIAYNYRDFSSGGEVAVFGKKRIARLYPLHLAFLLVFVGLEFFKYFLSRYIAFNSPLFTFNNIRSFLSSLLLLNSVRLPGIDSQSWNYPSWSISAEMISYFAFALLLLATSRLNAKRLRPLLYIAIVAGGLLTLRRIGGNFNIVYAHDYGFIRGLIGFFLGALCHYMYHLLKDTPAVARTGYGLAGCLELLFIGAIPVLVALGDRIKPYGYVYELWFAMTILIFSFQKGWLSAILQRSRLLHRIGTYSYSIYMTHAFVNIVFNIIVFRVLKVPEQAYAYLFIVNYLLVLLLSAWTHRHIEVRMGKLIQQRWIRKKQQQVRPSSPVQADEPFV